ncbi:MAG TPA: SRPBCC family protein [Phenylobacterium sp.]|jgi:uncharacterized protein YndB with AHSA1/START domain|nr:SRPBCC family protein [Phenylobacterium sp.]
MSAIDQDLGEVRRTGDTVEIVFRRRYAKPVEKIWAALTIPERISDWFGETTIEGDAIRVHFPERHYTIEGRIVVNEPMRAFAWTWANADGGESVVRFDLAPDGEGCRLTLTQSGLQAKDGAGNGAGWHAHLEGLADAAEGVKTAWATVIAREQPLNPVYKARVPA